MVTKKQDKQSKEGENLDSGDRTKLFGVDLKTIGGAIATAVVAEIAQTALSKAAHAQQNGDQTNHNSMMDRTEDVASSVGESLEDAATTAGDRLKNTASVAQEKLGDLSPNLGAGAASHLAHEILDVLKPGLLKLIEAVIESADVAYRSATGAVEAGQDAATDAVGKAAQTSPSEAYPILRSVQNGVVGVAKTARNAFEDIQLMDGKDGQKKKKKKKQKSKK